MVKYDRNYIEKNIIFTVSYPNNIISHKNKLNEIIPLFKQFLANYSNNIKKYKKTFPFLTLDKFKIIHNLPEFHLFLYTKPFINHPFLIYGNLNRTYYKIVIPFGDKFGQTNLSALNHFIQFITKEEARLMLELLNKTIEIRLYNLITDNEFSILKCENIKPCRPYMLKVNKLKYPLSKKRKLIAQMGEIFESKGKILLKTYFDFLRSYDFVSARHFLGENKIKSNKFKYQSRLDNYFMTNSKIVGHLKIFILLYEIHKVFSDLLGK